MRRTMVVALALAVLAPVGARAEGDPACPAPRCSEHVITLDRYPFRFNVLVPPDYDDTARRYPVLYLFMGAVGGDAANHNRRGWLIGTDLIGWTGGLPASRQAIVVLPDHGTGFDSIDGTMKWETFHIEHLIPYVDANFRTIAGRAYRAIAGLSYGGFVAMHHAARHPDLFVAAGSFSGAPLDISPPHWVAAMGAAWTAAFAACPASDGGYEPWVCGGYDPAPGGPVGPLGPHVTNEVYWRANDPTSIAGNLGGVSLLMRAGTGVPCDEEDRETLARTDDTEDGHIGYKHLEGGAEPQVRVFSAALARAGVAHRTVTPPCGLHSWRYFWQGLMEFWPQMLDAFGSPAPSSFDHRAVAPTFDVWDWSFTADAARAPEFLDVADASCRGVGLTGSGLTTVLTASCFAPGRVVRLGGAREASVVSDAAGRITFTVDLGAPHQHQQYTPAARALEAAGGYWTSRAVTFKPTPNGPSSQPIVDIPVSFEVDNLNRSLLACESDGQRYTIRGHITGPASMLDDPERSIAVHLHGGTVDERHYRSEVPGYHYAYDMAARGHTVLTVSELGYGDSGLPHGAQVCKGSQADTIHQVIEQLRAGTYTSAGARPAFARVAVGGLSQGGATSQIVAYSWPDDVDALFQLGMGNVLLPTPTLTANLAMGEAPACGSGGYEKHAGGPDGYAHTWPSAEAEIADAYTDPDPAAAAGFAALRQRDPCGVLTTTGNAVANGNAYLDRIDVPVLVLFGRDDQLFQPPTQELQAQRFTGSTAVTFVQLDGTGHEVVLDRGQLGQARAFRDAMSAWFGAVL